MVITEIYTQNNINPGIHDEALLHSGREPTAEELSYINQHSFDKASAYAKNKGWKLTRAETSTSPSNTEESGELMEGKACPKCGTFNNRGWQFCKECSASLSNAKDVVYDERTGMVRQLSEDEILQRRMQNISKPTIVSVIMPLFIIPAALVLAIALFCEGGFFRITLGIIIGAILVLFGCAGFVVSRENYNLAKSDLDTYKRKVIAEQDARAKAKDPETIRLKKQQGIELERQQAERSQSAGEPWTVRYATYPCPYCGHYKVRAATWNDKWLSVNFWGIASSAIGKTYKCEYCKRMW